MANNMGAWVLEVDKSHSNHATNPQQTRKSNATIAQQLHKLHKLHNNYATVVQQSRNKQILIMQG